ncbi:MAG: hypothetical protein HQL50_04165 [Magnetococcales bacterium]|nr:hypothetical protein [Magnetococcales bacterium]
MFISESNRRSHHHSPRRHALVGVAVALLLLPSVVVADPSALSYPSTPSGSGTASHENLDATRMAVLMRLFQDPTLRDKALALGADPAFQKALRDPAIMQALKSGNLDALSKHPLFRQLMNHGAVQDIKRNIM